MLLKELHNLIPQNIYGIFSDTYYSIIEDVDSLVVDESTVAAVKLGLTLGLMLTSFLAFYPGNSINVRNDEEDAFKEKLSKDIKLNNEKTKVSETSADIVTQSAKEGESNETKWAGDDISNEKLELTRKIFGLTKEEIQVVMQKSKEEALNSGKESNRRNRAGIYGNDINSEEELEDFITLSTKLNLVVYVFLILAIIYFLNRDYDNLATIWFTTTFPREAATLGIEIPQKN